jgi:hypothetical protein
MSRSRARFEWRLAGPDAGALTPADRERRRLAVCESRPAGSGDAPPLSTLPHTRASRAALELARGDRRRP